MKSRLGHLLYFVVCVNALFSSAFGQQCTNMQNSYSVYQDYSSDGTNIYTTVLLDGAATCSPTYYCPCNSARHTPMVVNKITNETTGASVGGRQAGTTVCSTCYLSYQNDQNTYAADGAIYDFAAQGQVACSLSGLYWLRELLTLQFKLAGTKSQTNFSDPGTGAEVGIDGTVRCEVTPYCTPDTSPPACNPSFVDQHPFSAGLTGICQAYYNTSWLAEKHTYETLWACIPLPPLENAGGTSSSSLGVCTKQ